MPLHREIFHTIVLTTSTGTASLFTTMTRTKSDVKRKLPTHLAFGVAYFPTPSQLYTVDLDYYQAQEKGRADIHELFRRHRVLP